jgi:hypothetical protein
MLNQTKLKNIELKGTHNQAIRFPNLTRQLDPETFNPINLNNHKFEGTIYNPFEIMGDNVLPEVIKSRLARGTATYKKGKVVRSLDKIEKNFLPIESGASNDKFIALYVIHKKYGLTESECFDRIKNLLFISSYKGKTTDRTLKTNIRSSFKNSKVQQLEPREVQFNFADLEFIESLVEKHPFAKQRTKSVKLFLERFVYWLRWHDEIVNDKQQLAVFDYIYTYYRQNRKSGLYPLPHTTMEKWNKRYYEIFNWLKEIKVIQDSGLPYKFINKKNLALSQTANPKHEQICKYYKVNLLTLKKPNKTYSLLMELLETKTQKEVGLILGVNQNAVSQWVSCKRDVSRKYEALLLKSITEVGVHT